MSSAASAATSCQSTLEIVSLGLRPCLEEHKTGGGSYKVVDVVSWVSRVLCFWSVFPTSRGSILLTLV